MTQRKSRINKNKPNKVIDNLVEAQTSLEGRPAIMHSDSFNELLKRYAHQIRVLADARDSMRTMKLLLLKSEGEAYIKDQVKGRDAKAREANLFVVCYPEHLALNAATFAMEREKNRLDIIEMEIKDYFATIDDRPLYEELAEITGDEEE